jgi:hypothetical protein
VLSLSILRWSFRQSRFQLQITVNDPLDPTSTGIAVGQDAYFVGFPCGLHFAKTYCSLPRVFGFVKRATAAQLDTMPDRHLQRDSLFLLFSLKRR